MSRFCTRCGWREIRATKTLCVACWDYENRTGRPRPSGVILRHLERTIDRR